MLPGKRKITEDDREFLQGLDGKCYYTYIGQGDKFNNFKKVLCEDYHPIQLNPEELERACEIARDCSNVFLMPTQGPFGFHPAYRIAHFRIHDMNGLEHLTPLLRFETPQLPKGYDFEKLAEQFNSVENQEKARFAGVEFEIREAVYTY